MQQPTSPKIGSHAIVVGGSIAGLLAARVLSDHFETVTLIERDRITAAQSEPRGVPQSRHVHVLLGKGLEIASWLFPDLVDGLKENGAMELDFGAEVRWHHYGGYKTQCQNSVQVLSQSRSLLESQIRQRVAKLSNVVVLFGHTVDGLLTTPDKRQVTGVRLSSDSAGLSDCRTAQLVVNAAGRSSRSVKWLESLGYKMPAETEVRVKLGYTSRIYRRNARDFDNNKGIIISANPPNGRRGGVVAPIEGDRWMVTLMGYLGDHPPIDATGFLEFARSLPAADIYNLIAQSESLSEPVPHKFPSSLRRHYEKLTRFPEGYLVLGDALCSFNPIFGQGMTVAALEAQALDQCLQAYPKTLKGLPQQFYVRAAQIIDTPWRMATGEDARYPEIEGNRSLTIAMTNWYIGKIYQASCQDSLVYDAFIQVMHMMCSPTILFKPGLLMRVLKSTPLESRQRY